MPDHNYTTNPSVTHNGYVDGLKGLPPNPLHAGDPRYAAAHNFGQMDRASGRTFLEHVEDPRKTSDLTGREVVIQKGSYVLIQGGEPDVKRTSRKLKVKVSKVEPGKLAQFLQPGDVSETWFERPEPPRVVWVTKTRIYQTLITNVNI